MGKKQRYVALSLHMILAISHQSLRWKPRRPWDTTVFKPMSLNPSVQHLNYRLLFDIYMLSAVSSLQQAIIESRIMGLKCMGKMARNANQRRQMVWWEK